MVARIRAPVEERTVESADGTPIRVYVVGRGRRRWLVPPAMGAPLSTMKPIFERLQDECTMVYWDMRGFHDSGAPADPDAYTVDDHLADLEAVRRAVGWERFVVGGWSMAVQLSLELYARDPDAVSALVLINGPYERALDAAVPTRALADPLVEVLRRARGALPAFNPIARRLGKPWLARALVRAGLLAHTSPHFEAVLADFVSIDWARYSTVMRQLHAHSAAAHLESVRVPTLITAGGSDRMSPARIAERMRARIPGAELYVIPEGTHYMLIEYGDELGERIAAFFASLG